MHLYIWILWQIHMEKKGKNSRERPLRTNYPYFTQVTRKSRIFPNNLQKIWDITKNRASSLVSTPMDLLQTLMYLRGVYSVTENLLCEFVHLLNANKVILPSKNIDIDCMIIPLFFRSLIFVSLTMQLCVIHIPRNKIPGSSSYRPVNCR